MKTRLKTAFSEEVDLLRKKTGMRVDHADLRRLVSGNGTINEPVLLAESSGVRQQLLAAAFQMEGGGFSANIMIEVAPDEYVRKDAVHAECMTDKNTPEGRIKAIKKAIVMALELLEDKDITSTILGRRYKVQLCLKHS